MAQFDVHRNSGRRADEIPYVVVVQSALFDEYTRRVVVPLVRAAALGATPNTRFNPTFKIGRTAVVLHPLEIVSVGVDKLGEPVASLATEGHRILAAVDELLSRAWG